jgi:hypothetical protein
MSYYPKEVINDYLLDVGDRFYESNDIIVFSDSTSLMSNALAGQKVIYARINENTFISNQKRYELCGLLLAYSNISDSLNNFYSKVDQTKFVFLYSKRNSFFCHKCYLYTYYYDHYNPFINDLIYGGINLDSINSYYRSFTNAFNRILAKSLSIDTLSLYHRTDKEGNIKFTESEMQIIDTLKLHVYIPLSLIPIPFDSVKPSTTYAFTLSPYGVSPNFVEVNSDEFKKYMTAVYLRTRNFYKYFINIGHSPRQ